CGTHKKDGKAIVDKVREKGKVFGLNRRIILYKADWNCF
ncbi:hypothetical protein Q604_UNBC17628G0001, partial [human gut metagenome]